MGETVRRREKVNMRKASARCGLFPQLHPYLIAKGAMVPARKAAAKRIRTLQGETFSNSYPSFAFTNSRTLQGEIFSNSYPSFAFTNSRPTIQDLI
jgi:hypothetical protein